MDPDSCNAWLDGMMLDGTFESTLTTAPAELFGNSRIDTTLSANRVLVVRSLTSTVNSQAESTSMALTDTVATDPDEET
jgi:hypothetical protein